MKQLVFIHGGETFDTYEEYLAELRTWTYELPGEAHKKWRDTLVPMLGPEWEVHMPSMPSKFNAKYIEWSIWFEKILPYLTDGVVFVGHSLGGTFLAKYLNEHVLPIRVAGTFLVAASFNPTDASEYSLADFILPGSLDQFAQQGGRIFLYHSEDDPVVPYSALATYAELLPNATVRSFSDRGHFLIPELPEIIADIRSIV